MPPRPARLAHGPSHLRVRPSARALPAPSPLSARPSCPQALLELKQPRTEKNHYSVTRNDLGAAGSAVSKFGAQYMLQGLNCFLEALTMINEWTKAYMCVPLTILAPPHPHARRSLSLPPNLPSPPLSHSPLSSTRPTFVHVIKDPTVPAWMKMTLLILNVIGMVICFVTVCLSVVNYTAAG